MEKTLEIRVKLHGELITAYKKLLKEYHTDGSSLFRAYIVELSKGAPPMGYPKKVILESSATSADYSDNNTLVIADHLKMKFPEYSANKTLEKDT
jgi:hypothetical protein